VADDPIREPQRGSTASVHAQALDAPRRVRWSRLARSWAPVCLIAGLVLAPYLRLDADFAGLFASLRELIHIDNPFLDSRARAEVDIARIAAGVHDFYSLNGGNPPEYLALLLDGDGVSHAGLPGQTSLPLDPWGIPYRYDCDSQHGRYRIYTLGRDDAPGGIGDDADIDNFSIPAARSTRSTRFRKERVARASDGSDTGDDVHRVVESGT
jgi:hypothetical protein